MSAPARQDRMRRRAQARLAVVGLGFALGFGAVGAKMAAMAGAPEPEPRVIAQRGEFPPRAPLTDRQGRLMATDVQTLSLYAEAKDIVDPAAAAAGLARIWPALDPKALEQRMTPPRSFAWIRRTVSEDERAAVLALGEPGLRFGPRRMRLYPAGHTAAHVMGGAGYGEQGVHGARIEGRAGLELALSERLEADPAPLALSLDMAVQDAVEEVLEGAVTALGAKGAAAVLMEARTGEIVALASLPRFDPNARPGPRAGDRGDDPLFNRAVQGVYELGSVFKIQAVAQALDLHLVTPGTMIDTRGPLRAYGHTINDFRNYGPELSVAQVIEKSSNIDTARIAQMIGPERQRAFLASLGLFDPLPLELVEAQAARPIAPTDWRPLRSMTASYGHGFSTSPVHLAAAHAAMVNGGHVVRPTLVKGRGGLGARVISPEASAAVRAMMRRTVTDGTASMAEVPGYEVGGKTGTADKPNQSGGYYEDKVIATFAGAFPMNDPEYVIVVTLDEPEDDSSGEIRRTAGWTATPAAAEIIWRAAPLLGLRPRPEPL